MQNITGFGKVERLVQNEEKVFYMRKVVFLGIYGVLQPINSRKRYEHDLRITQENAALETGIDQFADIDRDLIGSVIYDWSHQAIRNLCRLLDSTGSELVISSDWKRNLSLEEIKLLFRLQDIDQYITDVTPDIGGYNQAEEILEYLRLNPDIGAFLVVNRDSMESVFHGRMLCTRKEGWFSEACRTSAEKILSEEQPVFHHIEKKRDRDRRVVFLDIDGVLQPTDREDRFNHDLDETCRMLAEKFRDQGYLMLDKYDVGAVYYDWSDVAVRNLKRLLDSCEAEIVLSTNWKDYRTMEDMRRLFRIHGLDEYITDVIPIRRLTPKREEIAGYLKEHPKLQHYVVIDDEDMRRYFEGRMVYTRKPGYLEDACKAEAERILKEIK